MYQKPHFWKRFFLCLIAVILMGFCVSWLSFIELGTDPFSLMNFGISNRLGISFGNWQAIFNLILFVIVIWKDKTQIGIGTVLNMFLVGYSCDFMTALREYFLPDLVISSIGIRIAFMVVLLVVFVFVAAVYMTVELGTSPYDALPMIITNSQKKLSFKVVRILYDCAATVIGVLAGASLGIVTVLMAFTIGPVVAFVGKHIKKLIG
jgi:uncharacterized membrane protein YczE